MRLRRLWLTDFRSHAELTLGLSPGLTAVIGPNGSGKTNLLEAIAFVSRLKSFRGVPNERMIARGAARAFIRAEGERAGRDVLIELELTPGRATVLVNKQRLQRTRDLLGALRVTVFAPDDLSVAKEGPSVRREFLDDLLVTLDPRSDVVQADYVRVIRQRNTLLKQIRSRLDDDVAVTLDVYDAQLAPLGERLTYLREHLLEALMPRVARAYRMLAGGSVEVVATYKRSWETPSLQEALVEQRGVDVARAVTTCGPHRDDVSFRIGETDARSEASQGEQRTLALALRLAGHELVTEQVNEPPLLLLDDVLSELDEARATALLSHLPPGQTIITSATELPSLVEPDASVRFPLEPVAAGWTENDGE